MTEINTDYKQWALDMCTLLDRIEFINDDENIKVLCHERFVLAEKHGLGVTFLGETTGLDH